jgi:enediyne biosynthesis protein E4
LAKAPGAKTIECTARPIPHLEDITSKTGITFQHASDADKKFVIESMSGGVILFDYDRDGWLDIYFTNAPSVAMALTREVSRARRAVRPPVD